jgi:desulfoferrodoxin-like iron-binding protein
MYIQKDDWKKEKHMPVIEVPVQATAGVAFQVKVSIGKEIPHPNTTEHHIDWIDLYFHPEGEKFPHQVGHFAFTSHGEAVADPTRDRRTPNPAWSSPSRSARRVLSTPFPCATSTVSGKASRHSPLRVSEPTCCCPFR